MKSENNRIPSNGGFVLITALLLLVGLALLGASAMRTAIFDERAAGNIAFRSRAQNLAEAALRTANAQLDELAFSRANIKAAQPPLLNPRQPGGAGDLLWKSPAFWTSANSIAVPISGIQPGNFPRFSIEILDIPNRPDRNTHGSDSRLSVVWFRVTARATDPTTGAAVVLQETVRRIQ
jgi:Tfp pilus assembly protein PilX